MGSTHSVRASHYQRPIKAAPEAITGDEANDEQHISISNKMVERLVDDATLAVGAAAATAATATPRGDYKEIIFMEKLRRLDDTHSERCGITVEDLHSTATRIELRTANMISPEPVCAECKQKVIECYSVSESPGDLINCWDTVNEFTKCVHDTAASRLRARTAKAAREDARRARHVAHAREHALRELSPHPTEQPERTAP